MGRVWGGVEEGGGRGGGGGGGGGAKLMNRNPLEWRINNVAELK